MPGSEIPVPVGRPVGAVFFDARCGLCRNLAALASRRCPTLRFEAWQLFVVSPAARDLGIPEDAPADQLRVLVGSGPAARVLVSGAQAWEVLLTHHPDLKTLHWLAGRIGLTSTAARTMHRMASFVHRSCWKCR